MFHSFGTQAASYVYASTFNNNKCRLRESENRVSRRIFGPDRDEIGSWRKLHNEELCNLYSS
jgi:hypothetical protein